MKLIIAGSRTFTDYQLLCQTLAPERHRITQVITGGARGADQLSRTLKVRGGIISQANRYLGGFCSSKRIFPPQIIQVLLLGYRWAWKHAIRHQLFRADWERFGKSAGVRRNHQMAQAGDMLLAFWDGRSAGTRHMISCMQQLGKPCVIVRTDGQA